APEIPRALPVRRVGGDIGLAELGETGIAEIGMQLLVVVGQHLGEARDISVAVDAEQLFPLFFGAVFDLGKDRVVAGKDAALEALLEVFEAAHSAAARLGAPSTSRAMLRAWSSSSTRSARGGMLSSRSIMVDTGPKWATAARYTSHTSSQTGWSCVSTMWLSSWLCPATWNCTTRSRGTPLRQSWAEKP